MLKSITTMVIIILIMPIIVFSAQLNVPNSYPTIQDAVNAASNGDEIVIASSNDAYSTAGFINVEIADLAITITSDAEGLVTIDCNGQNANSLRAFEISSESEVTISGITIINGRHSAGGAILINNSSLTLDNCTVSGCSSIGSGGAIYADGQSTNLTITNCLLQNNTAEYSGGAIYALNNVTTEITFSDFADNVAGQDGGAVAFDNDNSGITINGSSFTANSTTDYGGAIALISTTDFAILNSLVAGNMADSHGGGVYISDSSYSETNTRNNKIINCTITENMSNSYGGGLRMLNSELLLANSIVYNNYLDTEGEYYEIAVSGESSLLEFAHNIINGGLEEDFNNEFVFLQTGSLASNLGGNLDQDPEFTNAGNWQDMTWTSGSYVPLTGSFCYNSGLNDLISEDNEYDIIGNARIQADYVDLGCYEAAQASGGDITGSISFSFRYPNEVIPGDFTLCFISMENVGDENISGQLAINLYLSSDKYISSDDTLVAGTIRDTRVNFLTARPITQRYPLRITVPGTCLPGTYYLLAHIDANNTIAEADESINSNVIASDPFDIYWKFGNFGSRQNAMLTLTDSLDVSNRYILRYGEGEIMPNRSDIEITSESDNCMLMITPLTRNVTPEIGNITCDGSLSIMAQRSDLAGDITVSGIMPRLFIGNIANEDSGPVISIQGEPANASQSMMIMAGNISDASLISPHFPINMIRAGCWLNESGNVPQIEAPWINMLTCSGDFQADMTISSAKNGNSISMANINGAIENCSWQTEGYISRLIASEATTFDLDINAPETSTTQQTALSLAMIRGDITDSIWTIDGNVSNLSAVSLIDSKIFIGTVDGLEYPTGQETDIADQYKLTISLSDRHTCISNSAIAAWEITRLSFPASSVSDSISYLEYFYSRLPISLPVNMNTNSTTND